MAESIVSHRSSANEYSDSKIWFELHDDMIERIFKTLPIESIARLRTVSKEWKNRLSDNNFFLSRREQFKEDPWLLLFLNIRSDCYRFNLSTMTAKPFRINDDRFVWGSVGGLVLLSCISWNEVNLYNPLTRTGENISTEEEDFPRERRVMICNPARDTFVQLPRLIRSKKHGIIIADILWKGEQYEIVTQCNKFIEVYDCVKRRWVTVQHELQSCWSPGDVVFFKGLFLCPVSSCEAIVFKINEDYTCQGVHVYLPDRTCRWIKPNFVVCGSKLLLITRDFEELCLWEMEHGSTFDITSLKISWKAIAKMPQLVVEFLNSENPIYSSNSHLSRHKFLTSGNYICVLREGSGKLAINKVVEGRGIISLIRRKDCGTAGEWIILM